MTVMFSSSFACFGNMSSRPIVYHSALYLPYTISFESLFVLIYIRDKFLASAAFVVYNNYDRTFGLS
jgi:hypothetical protein